MTLTNIIGDVGSGKTLIATYFATKSTKPVYCNFQLSQDEKLYEKLGINMPKFTYLKPEMLVDMGITEEERKTGSLVIIDEAYNWLESRTSGKEMNKYLSYICFQMRKKGMDIISTDQLLGTIDIRFREMENFGLQCENISGGYRYILFRRSRYRFYKPITFVLPYDMAEKYYRIYNTYEPISPIDKDMLFSISQDKEDIIEDIEKIVDILLDEAPAKKHTKGTVEYYCLKNKLPHRMAGNIYNAIKSRAISEEK